MKQVFSRIIPHRKSKRGSGIVDSPSPVTDSRITAVSPATEATRSVEVLAEETADLEVSMGQAAWTTMKESLKAVRDGSDLFPPLKAALVGVVQVMDTVDRVRGVQDDFLKAARRIDGLGVIFSQYRSEDDISPAMRTRLDAVSRELTSIKSVIEAKTRRGLTRRTLESIQDTQVVATAFQRLASMLDDFQLNGGLRTEHNVDRITFTAALEKLGCVTAADIQSQSPNGCMEGTRVDLLEELSVWSRDADAPRIFWLDGMAGTGKSAVARSFCHSLREDGRLGGSFFCSRRGSAEERDAKRILPTLASSLASFDATYKWALFAALDQEPVSAHTNVQAQMKCLFENPLRHAIREKQSTWVFVIDALDECADGRATSDLLTVLQSASTGLSIKFFLTSRPEYHIRSKFQPSQTGLQRIFRLHDIELDLVEADIFLYLTVRLREIQAEHSGTVPPTWPSRDDIAAVTRLSGKLFIYAFTAIEYVRNNPMMYLPRLTGIIVTAGQPLTKPLDDIYSVILSAAMNPNELEQDDIALTMRILTAILTVRAPLSVPTFCDLLGIPEHNLRTILGRLHAVISVPASNDTRGVLSTFHASFGDFLTTPGRAPDNLLVALSDGHRDVAASCITAMRSDQLCFNVSKCPTSYLPNSEQVLAEISDTLHYACLHWPHHIAALENPSSLLPDLEAVFKTKFLFWVEVLSAINKAGSASSLLRTALTSKGFTHASQNLMAFLRDANRFVVSSFEAIEFNPSHVYLSAIPCIDPSSQIAQEALSLFNNLSSLNVQGITRDSDAHLHLHGHTDGVEAVAFSPDGTSIASGSSDSTIRIWDAQTGVLAMPPLEGHINTIYSVVFSPDGTRIVSGSGDKTLRVWDAQTGVLAMQPLEGHTGPIFSVAFSPDGTRIASGSYDRTIRVWDAQAGTIAMQPLKGHTAWIRSVAFSPDGMRIVSGSDDKKVHVWDAQTGELAMRPLEGHTKQILSVAFSPGGSRIVSGSSDKTMRIWDSQTGALVMQPFEKHNDAVFSVAYSPDGTSIVSGSRDSTIRVWDAQTGVLTTQPLKGHTDFIWSVAFSPDGSRVVSGSRDSTIRVWDAEAHVPAIQPLEGHNDVVSCVALSPDGTRIVSGSRDFTIRVWDAKTGVLAMRPFQGHTHFIWTVAFSPDGTRIVSGSGDKTIRVWDAQTGALTMQLLDGHIKSIHAVAFSPDGTRIVSGSEDNRICVWDAQTGTLAMPFFKGGHNWIRSVAFSPDGTRIVSGSGDSKIRVWDAQTGVLVMKPLKDHTDWIRSVAFSPDGTRIVSGSDDRMVRVWDAQTGVLAMKPLEGHSDSIRSVAYSPDGTRIVSGSSDKTIRIWDAQTGALTMQPLTGHTSSVMSVVFSPDSTAIVSGSSDRMIRVWHVSIDSPIHKDTLPVHLSQFLLPGSEGWIKDPQGRKILWVPHEYRAFVELPPSMLAIGAARVTVDMSHTVHGKDWALCHTPYVGRR